MRLAIPQSSLRHERLLEKDLGLAQTFAARELNANDSYALKALRIEALTGNDNKYFRYSVDVEKGNADDYWKERCTTTSDHCAFGLFAIDSFEQQLIGMMMVSKWERDPDGKTAHWGSAYVMPEHRRHEFNGETASAILYKARLKWTKNHPTYMRSVFFIREGNHKSTAIHIKHGGKYIFSEPMRFANGEIAQAHWYETYLHRS